jgi:formate dehydrogenase iron-sulfur subunit
MAEKAMLIDTSLCMGCRGCQIACKQWWQQGVVETTQTGSYQNPPDLNWQTWSLLRFSETEIDGKLHFMFAKDQCRHCADPSPCSMGCEAGAISKNEHGGVVVDQSKCVGDCEMECAQYCPYDVLKPEISAEGESYCRVFKCKMCVDRLDAGKKPACAATCPTGAISFGDKTDVVTQAEARLAEVQANYPDAEIYPDTDGNAMWLLMASNVDYQLASRQDHPDLKTDEAQRPLLAAGDLLRSPILAAGCTFVGAMEALRYRKNKLADSTEE